MAMLDTSGTKTYLIHVHVLALSVKEIIGCTNELNILGSSLFVMWPFSPLT